MKLFPQCPITYVGNGDLTKKDLERFASDINNLAVYYGVEHQILHPPVGKWQNARIKGKDGKTWLTADLLVYEQEDFLYLNEVGLRPAQQEIPPNQVKLYRESTLQFLYDISDQETQSLSKLIKNVLPPQLRKFFSEDIYTRRSKKYEPIKRFIIGFKPLEDLYLSDSLISAAKYIKKNYLSVIVKTINDWHEHGKDKNGFFVISIIFPFFELDACFINEKGKLYIDEALDYLVYLVAGAQKIVGDKMKDNLIKASFRWQNSSPHGWITNYLVFDNHKVATDMKVTIPQGYPSLDGNSLALSVEGVITTITEAS